MGSKTPFLVGDLDGIRKVRHRRFFQLLPAEQQLVGIHARLLGHFAGRVAAVFLVFAVNHGVQVVGPALGWITTVAVGYGPERSHDFSHLFDPILVDLPSGHGVGLKPGLLVAQRGTEATDDPALGEMGKDLDKCFFIDADRFGQHLIGTRYNGDITLNRCDYLFFKFGQHGRSYGCFRHDCQELPGCFAIR